MRSTHRVYGLSTLHSPARLPTHLPAADVAGVREHQRAAVLLQRPQQPPQRLARPLQHTLWRGVGAILEQRQRGTNMRARPAVEV